MKKNTWTQNRIVHTAFQPVYSYINYSVENTKHFASSNTQRTDTKFKTLKTSKPKGLRNKKCILPSHKGKRVDMSETSSNYKTLKLCIQCQGTRYLPGGRSGELDRTRVLVIISDCPGRTLRCKCLIGRAAKIYNTGFNKFLRFIELKTVRFA